MATWKERKDGPRFELVGLEDQLLPAMDVLDRDKNGEISAREIEEAAARLKSLDRNNDGKLDEVELRPNPQRRPR